MTLRILGRFALWLVVVSSAQAATYYWDNNGATGGFGTASGVWAAPTPGPAPGWSTDTAGLAVINAVTTTTGDALYFGTETNGLGSGTIAVSGTQNVANLYFGQASGDLTLNGGILSFAGGGSYIRSPTAWGSMVGTHTINSAISKDGGIFWICNQTTTGENLIFNGVISGPVYFDLRPVNYASYIAFNATNTFSGNIGHVTGQVNAENVANAGVAQSLGTGAVYSMGGGGGQSPLLWYTGAGPSATDKEIRSRSNGDSRIVAQDGALNLAGPLTTTSAGAYNFYFSGTADTGTNTVSGVISDGSGTINVGMKHSTPQGASGEDAFWIVSGSNTYSGSTLIEAGTLVADHSHALGSGGIIDFNGGTLRYTANSAGTDWSTRILNSTQPIALDSNGENITFTNAIPATGNTGGLTKRGAGMLDLQMGTSYSGSTRIEEGTLRFSNYADLAGISTAAFDISPGATLEFESSVGGNNRTVLNSKTFTFESNGGGTINFNGGNHLFQGAGYKHIFTTLGGAKNALTSTNGAFMNMQGSGIVVFDVTNGTDDVDLELSVTWNNGYLIKNGIGTMSIEGVNNGSYGTTINAGTLLANSEVSNWISIEDGGTLGGTGSISGSVTNRDGGHISPGSGGLGTLTLSDGLTLNDGAVLDMDVNTESHTNDLIMVTGGTITGSGTNGVTVHVILSGLGSGVYTLMDWSAATVSGLDLADFNVVSEGSGGGSVVISNKQLLLHVTRGLMLLVY
ncbi:MAG: fibronectin-binding autotransporter adhesin [Candidatus Promineifilaceae bacterium]|jgi:fibronectin-binding autotransporter adhesin